MLLRNKQAQRIDFSRGVDLTNWVAENGWQDSGSTEYGLRPWDNYTLKELPPGYLADIVNLKFADSGQLTGRDVTVRVPFPAGEYPNSASANKQILKLASRSQPENEKVIYFVRDTVTNLTKFYKDGVLWFSKTYAQPNDFGTEVVYYGGFWWFYTLNTSSYFKVDAVGTVTDVTSVQLVSGLSSPLVYKDRIFGYAGSTVYYSKPTFPDDWASLANGTGGGNFTLGNGQPIDGLVLYKDSLWFLDREGSLFKFYYSTDPATDGVMRKVIDDINFKSIVVSDNRLWACTDQNVYEIINEQLIPVGDVLHLAAGKYDTMQLFGIGYGLMLVTGYTGNTGSSPRCFIYNFNVKAWTRYEFNWLATESTNRFINITGAVYFAGGDRNSVYLELGGPTPLSQVGVGNGYYPAYRMLAAESSDHADQYIRTFDGAGAITYQRPHIKIRSGPLYLGLRNQFKRFHFFLLNAYFGWKRTGTGVVNKAPYRVEVSYVPVGMDDKSSSTAIERNSPTEHAGVPYVISVTQRARAVIFELVSEDIEFWSTLQDLAGSTTAWNYLAVWPWGGEFGLEDQTWESLSATESPSPIFIDSLELVYSPLDRTKAKSGQTAYVDSFAE